MLPDTHPSFLHKYTIGYIVNPDPIDDSLDAWLRLTRPPAKFLISSRQILLFPNLYFDKIKCISKVVCCNLRETMEISYSWKHDDLANIAHPTSLRNFLRRSRTGVETEDKPVQFPRWSLQGNPLLL